MPSEETPLLADDPVVDHDAVYNRFSSSHKRIIVAITALMGTFPMFTSGSFVPLIPQIARDLGSTGSIVSLAVSLSVLSGAVGNLLWASYSGFYGRRPILLISMFIFTVGSFGSGAARTVTELLIWRVIQAFGASSGLSVGTGVIADMYKMEERGAATGTFFGAILFGMALAPTIAGFTAHFWSWRATQYQLFGAALLAFFLTAFLQPETSLPGARGLDKLVEKEGKARWVWLNPFGSITLLRSPVVFLVSLAQGLVVITDFVLLIPIAYTFGAKYGITNEAVIGALCIPVGLGNIMGSYYAGVASDRFIVSERKRRGGKWVPEDRLRSTLVGAIILAPGSILASGFLTQFLEGRIPMLLNFLCLWLNGVGVALLFNPSNAYLVDILHEQSAEVTAANMAARNFIVAISVGFILPCVDKFGVAITFSIAAVIAWIGFAMTCAVIAYGDRMRAWVDLGFSTEQNH